MINSKKWSQLIVVNSHIYKADRKLILKIIDKLKRERKELCDWIKLWEAYYIEDLSYNDIELKYGIKSYTARYKIKKISERIIRKQLWYIACKERENEDKQ